MKYELKEVARLTRLAVEAVSSRDEAIASAALAGATNREIAEAAGLTEGWVSSLLRRNGVDRPRGRPKRGADK